ncbi:PREDICTED: probable mitochondrial import inner membrane translocase subunit Tim17 3 [Drosophila arizonae]|uniref:Probable mitochondrial import inner membrane translocase subunit Tim17 3 n=1 Tax=Drosophila arizonae TaxID=7263 RepID=A0ABM1NME5_DROAR|nr:PREDICTED: probable mitochondrial import inner membrane translocase subunit Tim17 3 [Drosophila arizonae]
MVEYTRQPCPIRIVEDCGCAFLMGCIGGSMFQYMRGFRNSPTGFIRSLYGGLDSVKMKTPAIAGSFAVWGATFSTVDCTMVYYRQREDSWNSIVSGAATGGILAARNGIKAMGNGALVGGLVLAMIEGAGAAVATIYAAQPSNTGTEITYPQRPQWEPVSNGSSNSNDALAEIERVLDKCNTYQNPNRSSRCRQKPKYMDTEAPAKPLSLLELVRQANIFIRT